ncbi:hypothetical protein J2X65_003197 [Ancylobacter sp. 3268]|uniref:hypothetical protein n=1 Tax=Ancylobacter sp. 3268 TaxID=2817752 RepID=UPI0028543C6B|nr:hypothetical protein [Ancylobacter sp. 3268]MDR6953834.1 hypothetical protein [Ancylobacter sp. 3268]
MGEPVNIFVAGLGRCGTTMVMAMLDRGGFPVGDVAPDYESCTPMVAGKVSAEALAPFRGQAVKWLDPTISIPPAGTRAVSIWLDRDFTEQAKSQLKLCGILPSRRKVRGIAAMLRSDSERARRAVAGCGPVLPMSFERILAQPLIEAQRICGFLGKLDVTRAAATVRRRGPECLPDLLLEARLLREALNG